LFHAQQVRTSRHDFTAFDEDEKTADWTGEGDGCVSDSHGDAECRSGDGDTAEQTWITDQDWQTRMTRALEIISSCPPVRDVDVLQRWRRHLETSNDPEAEASRILRMMMKLHAQEYDFPMQSPPGPTFASSPALDAADVESCPWGDHEDFHLPNHCEVDGSVLDETTVVSQPCAVCEDNIIEGSIGEEDGLKIDLKQPEEEPVIVGALVENGTPADGSHLLGLLRQLKSVEDPIKAANHKKGANKIPAA